MMTEQIRRVAVWSGWLRLAHWALAVATLLLLATGWLVANSPALAETASELHYLAASVLLFGLLLRLFLGLFGRGAERLGELLPRRSESEAIRASLMFYLTLGRSPAPNWYAHNPLWKSLYLVLLVALAASVATGATMVDLPLLGGLYLPSVHRWLASLVGLLTLAHLYSVVLQDIKGRNADISAMFSGQRLFFVERTEPGRPGVTPVAIRPDEIKRAQDSQRQG